MQKNRDLALVIFFAVLSFVFWALIGQIPRMITGIRGIGYTIVILTAIPQAVAMLFFEGRRWRFFLMHTIFAFLSLPTFLGRGPFDFLSRVPLIISGFIADVVVNSFFKMAERQEKLKWWITLGSAFRWAVDPFVGISILYLYVPAQSVTPFLYGAILLLPLIIFEAAVGGYIGYKIYNRVKRTV